MHKRSAQHRRHAWRIEHAAPEHGRRQVAPQGLRLLGNFFSTSPVPFPPQKPWRCTASPPRLSTHRRPLTAATWHTDCRTVIRSWPTPKCCTCSRRSTPPRWPTSTRRYPSPDAHSRGRACSLVPCSLAITWRCTPQSGCGKAQRYRSTRGRCRGAWAPRRRSWSWTTSRAARSTSTFWSRTAMHGSAKPRWTSWWTHSDSRSRGICSDTDGSRGGSARGARSGSRPFLSFTLTPYAFTRLSQLPKRR